MCLPPFPNRVYITERSGNMFNLSFLAVFLISKTMLGTWKQPASICSMNTMNELGKIFSAAGVVNPTWVSRGVRDLERPSQFILNFFLVIKIGYFPFWRKLVKKLEGRKIVRDQPAIIINKIFVHSFLGLPSLMLTDTFEKKSVQSFHSPYLLWVSYNIILKVALFFIIIDAVWNM